MKMHFYIDFYLIIRKYKITKKESVKKIQILRKRKNYIDYL